MNRTDPWGLSPVTEADLQAYRDNNNGSLRNAASAAKSWVGDNWEYIAAGAMIVGGVALMCTGVGGPAGVALMAGSGALISAGASTVIQKHQNGSVDWGKVAVDGAIGGVAGAAGGGVGTAALRAAGRTGANCLARNVAAGAAAGAVDGGVTGGLQYATSGQPLSAGGLLKATAGGATVGGVTGGVVAGGLSAVSRAACFVAGTEVLMGDGSSKPIEHIVVGDEVTAADLATGETVKRQVLETYNHEDVETWTVQTSAGTVTSTAEHPFYVVDKGWTPVRELVSGDRLKDHSDEVVEVVSTQSAAQLARVFNLQVDEVNNYYVGVKGRWLLVHNSCVQTNRANGNQFRDDVAARLPEEGFSVVRTEAGVKTPFGRRYIDILAERNGELVNIETKLGRSRYHASQRVKDWWIANRGVDIANDGNLVKIPSLLIRGPLP